MKRIFIFKLALIRTMLPSSVNGAVCALHEPKSFPAVAAVSRLIISLAKAFSLEVQNEIL